MSKCKLMKKFFYSISLLILKAYLDTIKSLENKTKN